MSNAHFYMLMGGIWTLCAINCNVPKAQGLFGVAATSMLVAGIFFQILGK